MAPIDETRIREALANSKIQSFSSELIAVQSYGDDDALYAPLVRAIECEPFLLARVLRVANSVTYSRCFSGPAVGVYECLLRIGLTQAKRITEDFLIDQAIGRIARANRFSRSIWREAKLAGAVARLLEPYCDPPFNEVSANLPACLSYLGEIFVMGLVESEKDIPKFTLPKEDGSAQPDLVEISILAAEKLDLPKFFNHVLSALPLVAQGRKSDHSNTAAVILLSRALTKQLRVASSLSAEIPSTSLQAARDLLEISDLEWERLTVAAQALMERPRAPLGRETDQASQMVA
ncbi:MAG: hypothetical protein RIR70_820 [Pseudomonadota bacterium]|jgi:hypothetical protein